MRSACQIVTTYTQIIQKHGTYAIVRTSYGTRSSDFATRHDALGILQSFLDTWGEIFVQTPTITHKEYFSVWSPRT
jgi:hypothetical protein